MERSEAIALIRELFGYGLSDASWVGIGKREKGYRVELSSNSCESVRHFAESKNFKVENDKTRGFCVIYKP